MTPGDAIRAGTPPAPLTIFGRRQIRARCLLDAARETSVHPDPLVILAVCSIFWAGADFRGPHGRSTPGTQWGPCS